MYIGHRWFMSLAAHMTRKRNNACLVRVYKCQIDKLLETGVATQGVILTIAVILEELCVIP